jgi:hypothetical protein
MHAKFPITVHLFFFRENRILLSRRPTPAPADSGSAAGGMHLACEEYNMLARHSVYPRRCPLSQAVSPLIASKMT